MPFEGYGGFSFTATSVQKNAPPLPGVYGISNASQWIFVGAAANIQAALIGHLRGSQVKAYAPTGFTFELCDPAYHAGRQSRLTRELSPALSAGLTGGAATSGSAAF